MTGIAGLVREGWGIVRSRSRLPYQVPPDGDWHTWLLLAGRMTGKSYAAACWLADHLDSPPCHPLGHRVAVIAPTLPDAVRSAGEGPSSLVAVHPHMRLITRPGGTVITHPQGTVYLVGAHTPTDPDRLRAAGNLCAAWCEELAAWVRLDETWDQVQFAVRLGAHPRVVVTTTPKPRPVLVRLVNDPTVRVTRARTGDNPHAPEHVVARLRARYEGTRLGRQELDGELLDDFDGALWSRQTLNETRVAALPDRLLRVCIGVDPSAWTGETEHTGEGAGLETGIVVVGVDDHQHVYVVEDRSGRWTPDRWVREVQDAAARWGAHAPVTVVVEANLPLGAHLIERTDPPLRVRKVRARDGKRARAELPAALWEQGRAHIVGYLDLLEDQLCSWDPRQSWSPDRIDALVWAVVGADPWQTGVVRTAPRVQVAV